MVFISDEGYSTDFFRIDQDTKRASIKNILSDDGSIIIAGAEIENLSDEERNELPKLELSTCGSERLSELIRFASVMLDYSYDVPATSLDFLQNYQDILTGTSHGWELYGVEVMDDCVDLYYRHPEHDRPEVIRLTRCPRMLCFTVHPPMPEEEEDGGRSVFERFLGRNDQKKSKPKPRPEPTYVTVYYDGSAMEVMTGDGINSRDYRTLDGLESGQRALRVFYDRESDETIVTYYYLLVDLTKVRLTEILNNPYVL